MDERITTIARAIDPEVWAAYDRDPASWIHQISGLQFHVDRSIEAAKRVLAVIEPSPASED